MPEARGAHPDITPSLRCQLEALAEEIRNHSHFLDPEYVRQVYLDAGCEVVADPRSPVVAQRATDALAAGNAWSAIRIGEGEANLLAHEGGGTPELNDYALRKWMRSRPDGFSVNPYELERVTGLMQGSLEAAHCIGVRGLWHFSKRPMTAEVMIEALFREPRGYTGVWRSIRYMLNLAERGVLRNRLITSAYFYMGVLPLLDELILPAREIVLITSRNELVQQMRRIWQGRRIHHIPTGTGTEHTRALPRAGFLNEVRAALSDDLHGTLVLVGAGVWAEIYCCWVAERGGVAIDIGSGFDLLAGEKTRPIHRHLEEDYLSSYALISSANGVSS